MAENIFTEFYRNSIVYSVAREFVCAYNLKQKLDAGYIDLICSAGGGGHLWLQTQFFRLTSYLESGWSHVQSDTFKNKNLGLFSQADAHCIDWAWAAETLFNSSNPTITLIRKNSPKKRYKLQVFLLNALIILLRYTNSLIPLNLL